MKVTLAQLTVMASADLEVPRLQCRWQLLRRTSVMRLLKAEGAATRLMSPRYAMLTDVACCNG
jgi:hypothetical protein